MAVARIQRKRKKPEGAPNWIVTFADLATLLLTFFILLLSYSKMDVDKYKSMAASLAGAFGTSVIQDDAVGGSPLTLIESETPPPVAADTPAALPPNQPELIDDSPQGGGTITEVPAGITQLATQLIRELEAEVASGAMNVQYDTEHVIIRFAEDATFQSGSAELKPEMRPIIERVVDVLAECQGDVVVSGYTDNKPIVSSRYRSNWDLSAARAVSVVHELVMNRKVSAERVVAAGRAETNPLVPNTSAANRARNRRVEITVRDPQCTGIAASAAMPVEIFP
ncbi:flagellar motor protein MotB [Marinobacter nanhaiticus D15-8W]|uniref:Type VI secretion system protein TssL n=1 Tax=Marinobacter nanhaiticus D15-8W TaxID=626887 RepID=N6W528_9GAMM|nr:flagellar motor protein MotB [Marinobacter nanhaiticus]ENO15294.1 type VI secretion system protein TssL [Marinobacter nanhaiticus D15-8W]BES69003.1 flagellar motor protein MotB [Marinobacter nanhaiticus D15-8W]